MKKILYLSIPFITAGLMIGLIFHAAEAFSGAITMSKLEKSSQAFLHVTTLQDVVANDGYCSLREAIEAANTNAEVDVCGSGDVLTDTITFDVAGIITVTSQLEITAGGPLVVDGGGLIATSGGNNTRVWRVNEGSEITLKRINVINGRVDDFTNGAGLNNDKGSVVIDRCLFSYNRFVHIGEAGGGIYNWHGKLTVFDSEFEGNGGNLSDTYGGGIATKYGVVSIYRTKFQDNQAQGLWDGGYEGYAGGGMSIFASRVDIIDSSFIGNNGYYWGGAISQQGLSLINISGTSFISNTTHLSGAGIYSGPGNFPVTATITVTNSTFADNYAWYGGGGIDIDRGTALIVNSTITRNDAVAGASGIMLTDTGESILINNTIVANNTHDDCYGSINDGGHNLDSDGTCNLDPANGSLPNTDPLLGPLQDNGGLTLTSALLPGSPAIDAGDNSTCPSIDQRGVPRPQDGDEDGLSVCDMGSFEKQPPVAPNLVEVSGPVDGELFQPYLFMATVEPISTTQPITYVWYASEQLSITNTSGIFDTVNFIWEITGTKAITVTASNPFGSVSMSHEITILDVPISGLSASNDSPTMLGETTNFTAVVTDGTNVMVEWDFGDGFIGAGVIVSHTYENTGWYTAVVTAENSASSLAKTTLVSILAPQHTIYIPLLTKSGGAVEEMSGSVESEKIDFLARDGRLNLIASGYNPNQLIIRILVEQK